MPDEIRKQGPWQVIRRGDVDRLKLKYRAALDRDGYVIEDAHMAVFSPEV